MRTLSRLKMLFLLHLAFTVGIFGVFGSVQAQSILRGVLSIIYGDNPQAPVILFVLHTTDGQTISLDIPSDVMASAGGITALMGAEVSVTLDASAPALMTPGTTDTTYTVRSLTVEAPQSNSPKVFGAPISPPSTEAVTGSQTWLNLLCKFSGDSSEPFTPAQITGFYGSTMPLINHYWQQNSYSLVSIPSVTTTTSWLTLPHTAAYYLGLGSVNAELSAIFNDCTALHTGSVTFSNYYGINMYLNGQLGGYYWGTSCQYTTLQGVQQCWRNTWLAYYGFPDLRAYSHEMGHAYGLPHSNNSDGDSDPYDNVYDIMSGFPCLVYDPTYSCQQADTISEHKDFLGWIAPARIFSLSSNGTFPITLDRLSKATSSNYYYAYVPISGSHEVSIEARRNDFNTEYDDTLFNSGVILFDVQSGRNEPAWQINAVTDGASEEGPGVFLPGETYTDFVNGFSMTVNSQTADGYTITLYKGALGSPPDLALSIQSVTNSTGKSDVVARVRNNGSGTANRVYLAFDPSSSLFVNTITATPDCYQVDAWVMTSFLCSLGDMAPGAQLDIPLDVRPSVSSSVNLPLVVTSNELETNTADNRATAVVGPVTPTADAVVTITSDHVTATTSTPIHYQARMVNVGGATANSNSLVFNVPAGMVIDSYGWGWSGSVGSRSCTSTSSQTTCTVASLGSASGGSYFYASITAHATLNGPKTVTASVSVGGGEASTSNNSASLLTLIGSPATMNGTVTFPGRPAAPDALLVNDFTLTVTHVGSGTVINSSTTTTNSSGVFTVSGMTQFESYTFRIKGSNSLSIVRTASLSSGTTNLDFGSLKYGDANNDNIVNINDFAILAATFGKTSGMAGYDGRADFNGDSAITILDFSQLAANFGQTGQN